MVRRKPAMSTNPQRRPALFRALGDSDPPESVGIGGRPFTRQAVLKHDSWAATAVYQGEDGTRVACKFNRTQPLMLLPMGWLGRLLARRELAVLRRMHDVAGVPKWAGTVTVDDRPVDNAVAHLWIDGRPFTPTRPTDEEFFPRLRRIVEALHGRGIAHGDLSKWENILIGDDGRPYLLDYQVCFAPRRPGGWARWCLESLQAADRFHLYRHWMRVRPGQVPPEIRPERLRPGYIALAARLEPAWRSLRRTVLGLAGVTTTVGETPGTR